MKYYKLVCPDMGDNILMKRASHRRTLTNKGEPIALCPEETVFEIEMYAGEEYGYDQYDPDFTGELQEKTITERLHDYYSLSSLMSSRLLQAIQEQGVNNLQVFQTQITNTATDEPLEQRYFLVNILGMPACAVLEQSDYSSLGSTFYFHTLRIDPTKTEQLPIFRLAESPSEVIVNEQIAEVLRQHRFTGLTVEEVGSLNSGIDK